MTPIALLLQVGIVISALAIVSGGRSPAAKVKETAEVSGPTNYLVYRSNATARLGAFDGKPWIDSQSYCTGQLIYDIENISNMTVGPNIKTTWTVTLPNRIALSTSGSWGYKTLAVAGTVGSFSISNTGFHMAPGGRAKKAFALAVRCIIPGPIDWSLACSCPALSEVTIQQGSIFGLVDNQPPGPNKQGLINLQQLRNRGYTLVAAIEVREGSEGVTSLKLPAPFAGAEVGFSTPALYALPNEPKVPHFDSLFEGLVYYGSGTNMTFTLPPKVTAFASFLDSFGVLGGQFNWRAIGSTPGGLEVTVGQASTNQLPWGTWVGFYATGGVAISRISVSVSGASATGIIWGGIHVSSTIPPY